MARKPLSSEQRARKRERERLRYAERAKDPEYKARRRQAVREWERKNPDKKRAGVARYQKGATFKASRKVWWEQKKARINAERREKYRANGGKEKCLIRARRAAQRRREEESAQRAKAVQSALRLAEKASRIVQEKQYGITRKEAA